MNTSWTWAFNDYDPKKERLVEALCALGNGRFATRGAASEAGADDLFLIGGDADPPLGEFASAVELLPLVAEHPQRPRTIGVAGYPEGHPLISDDQLARALVQKSAHADYVATQMCFDAQILLGWIADQRRHGLALPVVIGMPGKVARRRLLEMSVARSLRSTCSPAPTAG